MWPKCIIFEDKSLMLDNVADDSYKVMLPCEPVYIDSDKLMLGRKHILVMQSIYDLFKSA